MGDQPGPGFKVEVTGLTDLADEVRLETDMTLRPQASQVSTNFANGVRFGGQSASGYVFAAKERYRESLVRGVEVLTAYVEAADVLAAAAEKVAGNYRQSDALSAARSQEVANALNAAIVEARKVQERRPGGGGRSYAV
jgi:hypothetical protein